MTTQPTITVMSVSVGDRLRNIQLALDAGKIHCVIGENGAGKSTLLDVIAGVLPPAAGTVLLGTAPMSALPPRVRAARVASLGQHIASMDATVTERIGQGLAPRRGSRALLDGRALSQVRSVAEELAVAHLLARDVSTLSGGERRRVEVARALVDEDAEALVIDEPHAGVDVRHQGVVSAALRARADAGKLVVVSVHDLGTAAILGDRIIGLRSGQIVVDGDRDDALTSEAIERVYAVSGAKVIREAGRIAVLMP